MALDVRLDRKSRTAIVALVLLLVAALLLPVGRYVVTKLHEKSQLLSYLENDEIVQLAGHWTIYSPPNSEGRRIADWLKSGNAGDQQLQFGDDDFVPSTATPTRRGTEHLAQLTQILSAYRDVRIVVMYGPRHKEPGTQQLERVRAAKIREELLLGGVKQDQLVVEPATLDTDNEGLNPGGLTLVLSRKVAS